MAVAKLQMCLGICIAALRTDSPLTPTLPSSGRHSAVLQTGCSAAGIWQMNVRPVSTGDFGAADDGFVGGLRQITSESSGPSAWGRNGVA